MKAISGKVSLKEKANKAASLRPTGITGLFERVADWLIGAPDPLFARLPEEKFPRAVLLQDLNDLVHQVAQAQNLARDNYYMVRDTRSVFGFGPTRVVRMQEESYFHADLAEYRKSVKNADFLESDEKRGCLALANRLEFVYEVGKLKFYEFVNSNEDRPEEDRLSEKDLQALKDKCRELYGKIDPKGEHLASDFHPVIEKELAPENILMSRDRTKPLHIKYVGSADEPDKSDIQDSIYYKCVCISPLSVVAPQTSRLIAEKIEEEEPLHQSVQQPASP